MNPFRLPKLDSSTLVGYREDQAAFKRFERTFAIPSYLGVIMAAAGISFALFFAKGQFWPILLFLGGMALGMTTLLVMFFSTPRSHSGRPMAKYWNISPTAVGREVVYVCDQTKTYFRRTWVKGGRNWL